MFNRKIIILIAILVLGQQGISQQFDKASVISDLEFLRESLEQTHYNLFAFTSEEEFEENYKKVKASITSDSLSILEVTSLYQQVISKANTGHAEIDFPIASYRAYAMEGGTVFPLEIAMENDRALIRTNFLDNQAIEIGSELISVDGMRMEDILKKIYPLLSAETRYFKNAKLEFWTFPRLYWQAFGQKDSFTIKIKTNQGAKEVTVSAVSLIKGYEMKRTDIISTERALDHFKDIAYLNPGSFSGSEELFKKFIDSAFVDIRAKKSKQLIVDLRNNTGGHNELSDYLVSYFADKPFRWSSRFTLKTSAILKQHTRINNDTTDAYFREILDHKNGEIYEHRLELVAPQATTKRFTGKVYVLINRHTYSMAAVTAALIQDYGFGIVVGEETGDHPTLHASQFQYTLPNTGIVVKVPKGFMVRPRGSLEKMGVVPDIKIKDHLVDEQDEILTELLKRLQN